MLSLITPVNVWPGSHRRSWQRSAAQTETRLDDEAIDKIEQRVAVLMRERAVPGVSIVVVSGGRVRWQRAFGVMDAASKEPVTEEFGVLDEIVLVHRKLTFDLDCCAVAFRTE